MPNFTLLSSALVRDLVALSRSTFVRAAAVGAALALVAHPALAATVDLSDAANAGISLFFAGIASFVTYVIQKHVKDKSAQDTLQRAAAAAIAFAQNAVPGASAGKPLQIDVASPVLAVALNYLKTQVPGAIDRLKKDDFALVKILFARVPGVVGGLVGNHANVLHEAVATAQAQPTATVPLTAPAPSPGMTMPFDKAALDALLMQRASELGLVPAKPAASGSPGVA